MTKAGKGGRGKYGRVRQRSVNGRGRHGKGVEEVWRGREVWTG